MKIASLEIRTAAIKAYDSGVPPQQIAETLGYHLNTINRWIRDYRQESRMQPLPRGHGISMFSEEELKQLVELLEKRPDMTLDGIRTHFDKQCSLNAVHKHVKILALCLKNAQNERTGTRDHRMCRKRVELIWQKFGEGRGEPFCKTVPLSPS